VNKLSQLIAVVSVFLLYVICVYVICALIAIVQETEIRYFSKTQNASSGRKNVERDWGIMCARDQD